MLDFFITLISHIPKIGNLVLNKLGYKLIKKTDYLEETFNVALNEPSKWEEYKIEEAKGSKFYFSDKFHEGYEKYFIISVNTKRYFKCGNQWLWIKRKKD